ncbi:hypothetical protein LMG28614_07084 [Paraburkholderia ultramafica]|uniref:Uncharacterized protein n=2 Tax=Paraburkholderia ultramafica TaxID=1544867 RepID=A0A6S7BRQ0_9BURK|nr:hypothetical protein LMG28614_07084 [Paraburkholderia ultramafica]
MQNLLVGLYRLARAEVPEDFCEPNALKCDNARVQKGELAIADVRVGNDARIFQGVAVEKSATSCLIVVAR